MPAGKRDKVDTLEGDLVFEKRFPTEQPQNAVDARQEEVTEEDYEGICDPASNKSSSQLSEQGSVHQAHGQRRTPLLIRDQGNSEEHEAVNTK